jgi:hypothetical protein
VVQQLNDRWVSKLPTQFLCCFSLVVAELRVCALFEEAKDDALITRPECNVEWSLIVLILRIDICTMVNKGFHDLGIVLGACVVEGRFSPATHSVHVYARIKKGLHNIHPAAVCCVMEKWKRQAALICVDGIGMFFNKAQGL